MKNLYESLKESAMEISNLKKEVINKRAAETMSKCKNFLYL